MEYGDYHHDGRGEPSDEYESYEDDREYGFQADAMAKMGTEDY